MTELINQLEQAFDEQHQIGNEIDFLGKHIDGFKPLYAKELVNSLRVRSKQVQDKIQSITNQINQNK